MNTPSESDRGIIELQVTSMHALTIASYSFTCPQALQEVQKGLATRDMIRNLLRIVAWVAN